MSGGQTIHIQVLKILLFSSITTILYYMDTWKCSLDEIFVILIFCKLMSFANIYLAYILHHNINGPHGPLLGLVLFFMCMCHFNK